MHKLIKKITLFISCILLLSLCAFTEEQPANAPVTLNKKELFTLKTGIGSFSAEERADALSKRLEEILKHPEYDIETIIVKETTTSSDIVTNGKLILSVTDRDAKLNNINRDDLAIKYTTIIQSNLKKDRQKYSTKSIVLGVLNSFTATFVFIILIKFINELFPNLILKVEANIRKEISSLYIQKLKLLSKQKILYALKLALNMGKVFLLLLLSYFYITLLLGFFPWTTHLSEKLTAAIISGLSTIFIAFLNYIPDLLFIVITFLATKYVISLTNNLATALENGTIVFDWFYPEWIDITRKLLKILIVILASSLIYPHLPGAESELFKGFSIFIGILVSIGSTRVLSNIISGIILTYARAFKVGERVRINVHYGDITEKDLLTTRIKTIKNEIISIPNSKVLDSEIINYSRLSQEDGLIFHTSVSIGYDTPRSSVESLLIQAAKITEHVNKDREPFVFEKKLEDYYIVYEINAYTNEPQKLAEIESELHKNIIDVFNAANVEILSPAYNALRDGNNIVIPDEYLSKEHKTQSFKIDLTK